MQINNVMGVTIGPGGYFLNFTEFGLQINAGHEVMMDRCWLGETNFDFDHKQHGVSPNATAIQINGNDHYILNTIVFSAKIGLEVNGAADYVTGVRTCISSCLVLAMVVHNMVVHSVHAHAPTDFLLLWWLLLLQMSGSP